MNIKLLALKELFQKKSFEPDSVLRNFIYIN
jgi:hypothetical protein